MAKVKPAKCSRYDGWFARSIQINHGGMMAVELRETFVQIDGARKMQILFF
jgi:hypothetical protein